MATIGGDQRAGAGTRFGEVILLDGRSVQIVIQPRLFAGDLFDMVASHFNLKEKEYFGLAFLDETGQYSWLNLELRVVEHEYAQKCRNSGRTNHPNDDTLSMSTTMSDNLSRNNDPLTNQVVELKRPKLNKIKKIKQKQLIKAAAAANEKSQQQHQQSKTSFSNNLNSMQTRLKQKFNHSNNVLSRFMNNLNNGPNSLSSKSDIDLRSTNVSAPNTEQNRLNSLKFSGGGSAERFTNGTDDPLYDVIHEEDDDLLSGNSRLTNHPSLRRQNKNKRRLSIPNLMDNENNYCELMVNNHRPTLNGPRSSHASFSDSSVLESIDCLSVVPGESNLISGHYDEFDNQDELVNNNNNNNNNNDIDFLGHNNDLMIMGDDHNDLADEVDNDNDDCPPLVLYFLVKYFVESITMLQDNTTIELFYLQAKSLFINEIVQVDLETGLSLSALVLQSIYGDLLNENKTRNRIHKLQLISSSLLKELSTDIVCEDRILEHYHNLKSVTRGESIIRFLTLIEKQPTYGVHFYEVKDKTNTPYWLGLSFKGINQFDHKDRRLPRRQFPWKQLENLYFREKKFSIEVRDPKRVVHTLSSINLYENAIEDSDTFDDLSSAICDPTTQVSVSRRTFGPCNVTVYVWFAASSSLTKCIWSMAISQHQFYIDRRINKNVQISSRSHEEIVKSLDDNHSQSILNHRSHYHHLHHQKNSLNRPYMSLGSISSSNSTRSSNNSLSKLSSSSSSISASSLSLSLNQPSETDSIFHSRPGSTRTMMSSMRSSQHKSSSRRLRILERQLMAKQEEIHKLDFLEQQILQKCRSNIAPVSIMIPSSSNQPINENRLALSTEGNSQVPTTPSHFSSPLSVSSKTSNNLNADQLASDKLPNFSAAISSTNSLKNFVVTGRTNSSNVSFDNSSLNLASLGHSRHHRQSPNPVDPNNQPVHQRSKSVGVSSKFSLDRKTIKKGDQFINSNYSTLPNPSLANTGTSTRSSPKSNESKILPSNSSSIGSPRHPKQSSLFSSPYVNKYDISVQNLANDDVTNLYSVPNRRTSMALNSFDDSFVNVPSKPTLTASPTVKCDLDPRLNRTYNNSNTIKNPYSFTTTSVTTSTNSVTLSTITYKCESKSGSSVSSLENQSQESIYATVDSSRFNDPANLESSVDEVDSSSSKLSQPLHFHHQNYRNIEDDNFPVYRSMLMRSNSFGSGGHIPGLIKRPQISSQIGKVKHIPVQLHDDYKGHHPTTVSSNYANFEPSKTRSSVSSVSSSNASLSYVQNPLTIDSRDPYSSSSRLGNYRSSSSHHVSNNNHVSQFSPSSVYSCPVQLNSSNYDNIDSQHLSHNDTRLYQNAQSILSNMNFSNSGSVYGSNSSMALPPTSNKSTKSWYETDLDFLTGNNVKQNHASTEQVPPSMISDDKQRVLQKSPVNLLEPTVANRDWVNNNSNCNSLSNRPSQSYKGSNSLASYSSSAQTNCHVPQPIVEQESSVDNDEDELVTYVNNVPKVGQSALPPSSTIEFAKPMSPYYHHKYSQSTSRPYSPVAQHHRGSIVSNERNSLVSPTPSNLSSTSSTASSFLFNSHYSNPNSSSGNPHRQPSAPSPINHYKPILYPLSNENNNIHDAKSNHSTTGSVLSLTRPISPICTVAFVPSVAGQDAVGINSSAGSPNGSITSSSTASAVPIASCKGNIVEVDVVAVGHFKPGYEETKPFTMSDFYKYSQRYRNSNRNSISSADNGKQPNDNNLPVPANSNNNNSHNFTAPQIAATASRIQVDSDRPHQNRYLNASPSPSLSHLSSNLSQMSLMNNHDSSHKLHTIPNKTKNENFQYNFHSQTHHSSQNYGPNNSKGYMSVPVAAGYQTIQPHLPGVTNLNLPSESGSSTTGSDDNNNNVQRVY